MIKYLNRIRYENIRIVFTDDFKAQSNLEATSVWDEIKKYKTRCGGIFLNEADAAYFIVKYPQWLKVRL